MQCGTIMRTVHARILIPPGIGDSYWVLTKLGAFIKREGLDKPELTILSYPCPLGSHLRSVPYLQLFDFFTLGDPVSVPNDPALQDIYDEAYLKGGRSIFPNVQGFDYFMAYNGRINSGGYIEEDDLRCDWYPPMNCDMGFNANGYIRQYGRYAVFFWPFYGTYESHVKDFPIEKIAESLNRFLDKTLLIPIFVGADWDIGLNAPVQDLMRLVPGAIDLIGKTSLVESFGLLRGAEMTTGYHAGLTNMAAVFGTKTCLLWDDRYPRSTAFACCPPRTRGTNYRPLFTKELTVDQYVNALMGLFMRREVQSE